MTPQLRSKTLLALAAVAMAALALTGTSADAATLTYNKSIQLSVNGEHFDISVFPGKARYVPLASTGLPSGTFGDGTVVDYRLITGINGQAFDGLGYANGGATPAEGRIAPQTSTSIVYSPNKYPIVWTVSDPDTDPADFSGGPALGPGTDVMANFVTSVIDITDMTSGSLDVIAGDIAKASRSQ